MRTCLTTNTFAKRIGFKDGHAYGFKRELHHLERMGWVEVQQGGFLADNLNHEKIVVIRNEAAVLNHFKILDLSKIKRRKYVRRHLCKHETFLSPILLKEIRANDKLIKQFLFKCAFCPFYYTNFEVTQE